MSTIHRIRHGELTTAQFRPSDFGVPQAELSDLKGGDTAANAVITRSVLEGATGPQRDVVVVNAAPAIVAAGLAEGFADGIALAVEAIDGGAAAAVLERAVAFSAASIVE